MCKFFSYTYRKKTIPSPPGTHIYKWSYVNSKGELVGEERDLDAMIQSYAQSVNYKEIIENYGMDNEYFNNSNKAMYGDVTEFNEMDYADVNGYISALIKELNQALAVKDKKAPTESIEQSKAPTEEGAKIDTKVTEQGGKE